MSSSNTFNFEDVFTNSTEYFNVKIEVEEITVFDKIISGITWGLFVFPCNALMFGIVQFDRLGGDPLKRRVTDQLFSNCLINLMINHVLRTVSTIQVVFELQHVQWLTLLVYFLKTQVVLFAQFTVTEICLFKYWLKFIRKRLVTMEESFIVTVLTLENLMMSLLFAASRVFILSKFPNFEDKLSFDVSIYVTFILIFVSTVYASHTLFDYVKKKRQNQAAPINSISGSLAASQKGKRRRKSSKNSSIQNNEVPPQPAIQLNNNQYNPEVLEKKYFLLTLSLFSFVLIPSLFIYFSFDNSFLEVFSRLVELGFIQSLVVIVLSVFPYATNQSLRRFASESFQC